MLHVHPTVSNVTEKKLGLSPKTVDVHRARIMERLGTNDLPGLTLYCVRHGLIDPVRDA